jgi:UDP-GlcNAc3NAcA epimerase
MKLVTIIGARPQIIKAAAISRAIRTKFSTEITEIIVHTGQHYDANMSAVFFEELEIPKPNYNLNVGSGKHGEQTAKMLSGIEEIILTEKPNALLVYGDTNSTVAGSLAAAKIEIPVVHIEAGLRSFNKAMPEELNRIACDHMSTLLFSPTLQGVENLKKEGFQLNNTPPYTIDNPKVYHCGDIMYDNSTYFAQKASINSPGIQSLELDQPYILATIHRNANTDDKERINSIFSAILYLAEEKKERIILPLHPRTKKMMDELLEKETIDVLDKSPFIHIIEPVSFLEMIALEKNAKLILTDSGGVQKEAYFFQKPSIILRPETEWIEIVAQGTAILCDADDQKIIAAYTHFSKEQNLSFPSIFGDGKAAEFICNEIYTHIK